MIVSVGGGGMALGVIQGMIKHKWLGSGVKLICVETIGADCFNVIKITFIFDQNGFKVNIEEN